jgi:hypothetical protein
MSRVRIVTVVWCVGLVTAVVAASPAHADRYRKSDSAGDMWSWYPRHSVAPARRNLDLRQVLVRHTHHMVMIRAVMSELRRPREGHFLMSGYLKVNHRAQPQEGGRAWAWSVEFTRHHPWHGRDFYVTNAVYLEQDGCQHRFNPRLRANANYARDRVTVFIPRFCLVHLARPRWVRASVSTEDDTRARWGYFDHLGKPQPRRPWPDFHLWQAYFTPRLRAG